MQHQVVSLFRYSSALWRQYCASGFALLLLLFPVQSVQAIVIRHDRADASYVVDAKGYPQVFYLHTSNNKRVCMATLIAPHWALTAAHCTEETPIRAAVESAQPYALQINGADYQIAALAIHPQYRSGAVLQGVDLALIRLDRDVPDLAPLQLNRQPDELDKVAVLLGWGHTGPGTVGRQGNDGKFRRANNAVSEATQWLSFLFDDPRVAGNHALNLEGVPGLGDSGGPALEDSPQGLQVLGVALGELENAAGREHQGRYGATEIYERVYLHLEWIDQILSDTPAVPKS